MRFAYGVIGLVCLGSLVSTNLALAAPKAACFDVGDQSKLDPSDQRVTSGAGIFHVDNSQYPFSTYSLATRHPTSPNRICLRYEIENDGTQMIQSFRWKDIELPFTDVPPSNVPPGRTRWDNDVFSKYDHVGVVTSNVTAFGDSVASTRALIPVEQIEHRNGPQEPIQLYKVSDQFPSVANFLITAGIPLTPVLAVPRSAAGSVEPLVSRFRTGGSQLIVSNEFISGKSVLATEIAVDGPSADTEPRLFAPGIQTKQSYLGPISADSIIAFAKNIQERRHEQKLLFKGVFYASEQLPKESSQPAPMFFVVKYPITVETKGQAFCVIVSGLSAYPVNIDDRYCERR